MKAILPFGLPLGISTTFWGFVGIIRYLIERTAKPYSRRRTTNRLKPSDIAVIIPAHNEELVVNSCIRALKQTLPADQIYVISDGSTDKTFEKALEESCNVSNLEPGRGKAKALVYTLKHYRLFDRYKLIFIVDADTRIDKSFITNALPLFDDPLISVVFGTARINWPQHVIPSLKFYYIAYRERLNRILQYMLIYGQTWKYTNVNYVIPGFATIYRSDVLRQLEIDTPGLLIEDFNLAFQLHHKKIGKIGYKPACIGWDQHPDNLTDYWKQVRRWNIGFFQTIRKNGIWPSVFWLSLAVFSLEIFLNSIFLLLLPIVVLFLLLPYPNDIPLLTTLTDLYHRFGPYRYLSLRDIFLGLLLTDYAVTLIIGAINKKPQFAIYGLFFFIMHYITALILVTSFIPGFFQSSNGRWVSPTRRAETLINP